MLFFFMLFVLGIGCLIALQSAVVTVICDQFQLNFWAVALVTCVAEFLLGLMYTCPVSRISKFLRQHYLYAFSGRSMDVKFDGSFWWDVDCFSSGNF